MQHVYGSSVTAKRITVRSVVKCLSKSHRAVTVHKLKTASSPYKSQKSVYLRVCEDISVSDFVFDFM